MQKKIWFHDLQTDSSIKVPFSNWDLSHSLSSLCNCYDVNWESKSGIRSKYQLKKIGQWIRLMKKNLYIGIALKKTFLFHAVPVPSSRVHRVQWRCVQVSGITKRCSVIDRKNMHFAKFGKKVTHAGPAHPRSRKCCTWWFGSLRS